MKKTFLLLITLILSFLLISCNEVKEYEIKYYIGEELYKTSIVKEKEKVEDIEVPEIEYYEFKCWVNKENNEEYDLSLPVKGNLELTAKYEKIANLAGGDKGKNYNFSNLTDEEMFEAAEKLENFLLDKVITVPFYSTVDLFALSDRIEYPVSLKYKNYELYSKFSGEDVFRYVEKRENFDYSHGLYLNGSFAYKGLYSYEYNEDLLSNKLVPYFADGDPIKVDEEGKKWKVYIQEGFKHSDGTDVLFEDFVAAYEANLNSTPRGLFFANVTKYRNGECTRDEVGISYNYEEKSITFEFDTPKTIQLVKHHLTDPFLAPTPYIPLEENVDFSGYKFSSEYILKSYENGVITYEKNPYYISKGVNRTFSKIEIYVVDTDQEAIAMFEKGLVDYMEVPDDLYYDYFNQDKDVLKIDNKVYGLYINLNKHIQEEEPILYNQNFRKALYYGIDRNSLYSDSFNPCHRMLIPNSYLDSYYKVLYPIKEDVDVYDAELALDYYIQSLKDLSKKGYFSSDESLTIELEVAYYFDFNFEEVFGRYEELFNSQEIFPNIEISFIEKKMEDFYEFYHKKFVMGDYDIIFYNLYSNREVSSVLGHWAFSITSSGSIFTTPLTYDVYKDNLIEFKGEYFVYEALCYALPPSISDVYIVNGRYKYVIIDEE